MPALMAQRSSAARNEIRRELDHRRKVISVATGRVVKKFSASPPPPPPRLIPSAGTAMQKLARASSVKKGSSSSHPIPGVLIPTGAPGADRKIVYMDLGEAPKRLTMPRREAPIPRFTMKAPKLTASTALIPRAPAPAAVTKLSAGTEQEHKTTGAETKYTKKSSSAPIKKGMTVKMRTPAGTLPTGQRLVILNHAVVVSDVEGGYVEVVYKGKAQYSPMRIALDQVKAMPPTKTK